MKSSKPHPAKYSYFTYPKFALSLSGYMYESSYQSLFNECSKICWGKPFPIRMITLNRIQVSSPPHQPKSLNLKLIQIETAVLYRTLWHPVNPQWKDAFVSYMRTERVVPGLANSHWPLQQRRDSWEIICVPERVWLWLFPRTQRTHTCYC